jgi:nucleoside-diphosphate-sugar epimerase
MDVRDAGDALAALALSDLRGPINIAGGTGASIASIAELLGGISGRPDLLRYGALPDRAGDPPRIVAATRRLRDELGFRPRYALQQGLADAYEGRRRRMTDAPA